MFLSLFVQAKAVEGVVALVVVEGQDDSLVRCWAWEGGVWGVVARVEGDEGAVAARALRLKPQPRVTEEMRWVSTAATIANSRWMEKRCLRPIESNR